MGTLNPQGSVEQSLHDQGKSRTCQRTFLQGGIRFRLKTSRQVDTHRPGVFLRVQFSAQRLQACREYWQGRRSRRGYIDEYASHMCFKVRSY